MIEYPKCVNINEGDCWYLGHKDRLNEYKKSYKVVNDDDEAVWYCEVCFNNMDFSTKCNICKKYMLNGWIVLDNINVCICCVEIGDIMEYIDNLEESEGDIFIESEGDIVNYSEGANDSFLKDLVYDLENNCDALIRYPSCKEIRFSELLKGLVEKTRNSKEDKKKRKKIEIQQRFDNNCDIIRKTIKISEATIKLIVSSLDKGVKVPLFIDEAYKRDNLLLWLLEQKRN